VPQPNIFSATRTNDTRRRSFQDSPRERWVSHSPINLVSSTYQADHDAALRASLSTLLSCAAAVRGSPKQSQPAVQRQRADEMAPTTFRILSEADFMSDDQTPSNSRPMPPVASSPPRAESPSKGKRKGKVPKDSRKTQVATVVKPGEDTFTPTLLTWAVSAGVLVLVSAITFSAGYAMGKEIGHAEAQALAADASCRSEVVKSGLKDGLQRFRWAAGASAGVGA